MWTRTMIVAMAVVCLSGACRGDEFPREWFWGKDAERARHATLEGKPMPLLDLSHWMNGEVTAADMKGKIVVVDFWATWCGPCIAAIPKNNAIHEKYAEKGVIVLGVCGSANGQEKMPDVVKDKGIKYPVARDAAQKSDPAWAVMWWPTYGVVDRTGTLRALGLKPGHVEAVVQKLLEEDAAKGEESKDSATKVGSASDTAAAASIPASWLEGDTARRRRLDALAQDGPPALQVREWINSEAMAVADLKGKVVVLDFWATWCGPCIASIPHTNDLYARYKDQGMEIIGVCHSRGAEKMAQTAKDKDITYPIVADVEGKTVDAYRVDGFPDYYIIDRAGTLRVADCANGSVEAAIKLLLAEQP